MGEPDEHAMPGVREAPATIAAAARSACADGSDLRVRSSGIDRFIWGCQVNWLVRSLKVVKARQASRLTAIAHDGEGAARDHRPNDDPDRPGGGVASPPRSA
ncbi:hypothetical protein GCM10010517_28540 [Streptosporangium fragile]|uniref:Uncharacterized protein n=1 Tax=Streptosporangium fragile TaxID=46186 RepID=A0ABN3VZ03_9ACTN